MNDDSNRRLFIILEKFPQLTQTFIANEVHYLANLGMAMTIVNLRRIHDIHTPLMHNTISGNIVTLPQSRILLILNAIMTLRRKKVIWNLRRIRRSMFFKTHNNNDRGSFFYILQALYFINAFTDKISHVHAFFLNESSTVAFFINLLADIPWSCSAHSKDIYTLDEVEIGKKIRSASWVATCTRFNFRYLTQTFHGPDRGGRIYFAPHGIDLEIFRPDDSKNYINDGSDQRCPVIIISVGRVVPKKGYDILLRALEHIPVELNWRFMHVGPRADEITKMLKELNLPLRVGERVIIHGATDQIGVRLKLSKADIFCLACRTASDGDKDGRPNALLEAQAMGLPAVVTNVSALPELVENDFDGYVVPSEDPEALTRAITRLICVPEMRRTMGERARAKAKEEYNCVANAAILGSLLVNSLRRGEPSE